MPASAAFVACAPWFGIQAVSLPSSSQDAAAARVSIGAGVLGLVAALGDDHRQRLTDVPDRVRGQQRLAHLGVDHTGHRRRQRQAGQVGAGERGDHAGRLERGADVNGPDPRVRDHRTDEVDVARAGKPHVVGVDATGGQEAGIFGPDDPGAQYAHVHDLAWPARWRSKRYGAPRGMEDRVPLLR